MNQAAELKDSAVLHKPELHAFERDGIRFFVDTGSPNWISTDTRGARLLEWIDGKRGLGPVRNLPGAAPPSVRRYESDGPVRNTLRNAAITFLFYLGVPPRGLARLYR